MPGTLESPPATAVPPMTTTAIDVEQIFRAHVERRAAGEAGEQVAATRRQHGAEDVGDEPGAIDRDARHPGGPHASGRSPRSSGRRWSFRAGTRRRATRSRAMIATLGTPQRARRGEVGEEGRRLDAQAAVGPDRGRLHDEAHRQRGDDRRDAQRLDERVVADADADADQDRDDKARQRSWPFSTSISFSATVPASVMVAGTERSILPGPSVMTNIWPMPTMIEKAAKVKAACDGPSGAGAAGEQRSSTSQTANAAKHDQIHGLRESPATAHRRFSRFSRRLRKSRSAEHDDQDRALRPDLPVGRDPQEGQERAGKRQRQRADDGTDRRHAAADELAAAEDDAGNRQQRVAKRDIGIRRGREADERNAGRHGEEAGRGRRPRRAWRRPTSPPARPSAALPPTPRISTPSDERITTKMGDEGDDDARDDRHRHERRLRPSSASAPTPAPCRRATAAASTASPPQTKLMPSVTTIDGRLRRWMTTPSTAVDRDGAERGSARPAAASTAGRSPVTQATKLTKVPIDRSRSLTVMISICAIGRERDRHREIEQQVEPDVAHGARLHVEDGAEQHRERQRRQPNPP